MRRVAAPFDGITDVRRTGVLVIAVGCGFAARTVLTDLSARAQISVVTTRAPGQRLELTANVWVASVRSALVLVVTNLLRCIAYADLALTALDA